MMGQCSRRCGRLFQAEGIQTAKLRCPYVEVLANGTGFFVCFVNNYTDYV